jgi:hypothetical protein
LNELSSQFESNEITQIIKVSDDIGTISDSLEASANGKSDGWWRVNDSVNGVSTKLNDKEKSMQIVTHNDRAICSDQESSFENDYGTATQPNAAEIDCNGDNSR